MLSKTIPHTLTTPNKIQQYAGAKGSGGGMQAIAQQVEEVAGLYAGLARAVDNSGGQFGFGHMWDGE